MSVFEFDAVYGVFEETSIISLFSSAFPDAKAPWINAFSAGISLHCQNPSAEITADAVMEKASVSETELIAAVKFWIKKGILRKTAYKSPKYKYTDPVPLDPDLNTLNYNPFAQAVSDEFRPYCYAKGKRCIGYKTDARSFIDGFDNVMLHGAPETVLRNEQELRHYFLAEGTAVRREKSCGAVVYKKEGQDYFFLLEHMVQGHTSIPKGHVEENETEEETAAREIREETNLQVTLDTSFRHVITYSPGEGIIKDVVFFIAEAAPGQMINQESEVTSLEWLPYEAAYLTLTHQSDRETLQKAWEYLNRQAVSEADKETRNDS